MTDSTGFRDDPEWQLARAEYLSPDADTSEEKLGYRILATAKMREIERRYG